MNEDSSRRFIFLSYESTRRKSISHDPLFLIYLDESLIQAFRHLLGPFLHSLPLFLQLLAAFGATLFPSLSRRLIGATPWALESGTSKCRAGRDSD
jgi:hypothetical protein